MTLSRDQLVRSLAALEPRLRGEGVTALALFGSRARGDNRTDSDVDVVIDVATGARFSLLDLVGVAHEIEDELGLPASIVLRRSLDPALARTIAREAIRIFG
ncbi:MAG: nucleotidyltransferase domain-containing protein [Rhizobiales bacterium]|nr:nucleotidyltransferase domain-containing protein [Hyphomicrobiales bacterium]